MNLALRIFDSIFPFILRTPNSELRTQLHHSVRNDFTGFAKAALMAR